jgi:integrase
MTEKPERKKPNRKARRGRGEGGIRYREDKQLWVAEVRTGGKRVSVYGTSKVEVQEKLRKLHNDVASGIGRPSNLTVGQWLTQWLALVKPTVEPGTYRPYEINCRLHITPHIGSMKLVQMKKVHVQALYSTLAKGGMSPAMQRKVGTTLVIALNEALDLELIPANPAVSRRTKRTRKPKADPPKFKILTPDELAVFLDAARIDRHYALYHTALDSGARPGELFALDWPDVDLDLGHLIITKSLEEIAGALRLKPAKTDKSRRRIDLSAETVKVLADHRKAMLAAGFISRPVFCDSEGGHIRLSNLHRDSFKPLLKRAGLPHMRLYDLRHTCATLLLLADVPAKVVSERLGHSTITLTMNTYSHVLPTMQKKAADALGKILGRQTLDKKAAGG